MSKLSADATEAAALPYVLPRRESEGRECGRGVWAPERGSLLFAQARKTASRIEGVNSDNVRWDCDSAARRRRFFCENVAWVSVGLSREMGRMEESSSTGAGSCAGLARGSIGFVDVFVGSENSSQ